MGNFKKISKKMHYFVREPRNNEKRVPQHCLKDFCPGF